MMRVEIKYIWNVKSLQEGSVCAMMNANFTPILVVPAIPLGKDQIKFLHYESAIDIENDENEKEGGVVEKIWTILRYCNGYNTIQTISSLSSIPIGEVFKVVTELIGLGVMVESRELYRYFDKISAYPMIYNWNVTQDEARTYRKECGPQPTKKVIAYKTKVGDVVAKYSAESDEKRFSSKDKLSWKQVIGICDNAYPIKEFTDYSEDFLKIYVLVEKDQYDMDVGYYEYLTNENRFALFDRGADSEQLKYCFNDEELPFGSSVQIVLAADFGRQAYLYANHAYRSTLVEVGRVVERIFEGCRTRGLYARIIQGMQDVPLATELALEVVSPVVAIAVGYEAEGDAAASGNINSEYRQSSQKLMSDISDGINIGKLEYAENESGEDKPVYSFWGRTFGEDGSFFGVNSIFKDGMGRMQYAGATSTSYADAAFKAVVEGYERWTSGRVRVDYHGPANELDGLWLDPQLIMTLTEEQAAKCNLKMFRKDLAIDWTLGERYDGKQIYVPSDIVYYGQKNSGNRIYWGHSSGVAAYSNYSEAQKRALVELIERDALMRNWYSRRSPNKIDRNILPIHAKKRMRHWQKQGRKVIILEMPSKYGWVFEAVIVSDSFPVFVSGAAATIDRGTIPQTICKALEEAEYILLLCLKNPDTSDIDPKQVMSPAHHGKVYYFEKNAETLAWLWNGKTVCRFAELPERKFDDLAETLEIVTVDMTEDKAREKESGLSVVRVFSSKLVPINFGFNSAHYTHPALDEVDPKSLEMPHYFA